MITPREIIRDFIELLDIVLQNPGQTVQSLLTDGGFAYTEPDAVSDEKTSDFAEFTI